MFIEHKDKYRNTKTNKIYSLPEILIDWTERVGEIDGFEDYVLSGFCNPDDGNPDFVKLENKNYNIENLFPDWQQIDVAQTSVHSIKIEYGERGEYLELSLFHSEDNEWHFNFFECNIMGDIHEMHSVNATRLNNLEEN